jgi:hypothetical protein
MHFLLCTHHKMAWAYSVTLFHHCVLPLFRHHQFPFIILVTVAHIQLKFDIRIYLKKIQVKFEFGHGQMIFDTVMPLDEIFSFRSLSPQWYYTVNSNLTYGYIKEMRRSSSNLVMVQ